ncbi:Auxin-responsive protein [Melia azedarach]|uniref:Auxin-responsive protein n=1 Tax=Melia azedarach TaxID=155640 RepID=A0ACC1XWP5_MELAZ|nr:Auxin-responsive protein [Melia azedarach]
MISTKNLIKLARKWRKLVAKRKRITLPIFEGDDAERSSIPSMPKKGQFVVYTADQKRFLLPLEYLNNKVVQELFKLAEEEFGLPTDGPTKLPCDAAFMETTKIADAESCTTSSVAEKGHFVVYSADEKRFAIPLVYLENNVIRELFKMAEDEFGLPSSGPITLPCDAVFMEYLVSLIQRHAAKDVEQALLMSLATGRCLPYSFIHQEQSNQQSLICGF